MRLNILEVLNSYPGETFIQEHAKAITQHTDIQLSWAFWQTDKIGKLKKVVPELYDCVALANPNRLSGTRKAMIKASYFNAEDAYVKALKKQVRHLKPDIIHFHFATLAVQHHKWVLDLNIPFTFSIRGSDIQTQTVVSKEYSAKLAEVTERAIAVHSVCEHLTTEFFNVCGANDKTTVIRTAIGDRWRGIIRNPVKGNILSVGRLHWRKGYPDLLVAGSILRQNGADFRLTIIGEGDQRQQLEFMIRDLSLNDCVNLVGKLPQELISSHFAAAHAFVLPSLAEGFPNVVAEAVFARVPVIASEASNVSEIFSDDEVVLTPSHNPEKLAENIMRFVTTNEPRVNQEMTDRAFKKSESIFSHLQHAKAFQNFWKKI